jgi:pSer/pThr/pTyr-binding forkhead associated (FHA) protein/tetratricopeptide (TPR) repeat protein
MKLIIEDDEGRKTVVQLLRDEITIGRQDGNTIKLTERNVSRRHARFVKENGSLVIEDLGSYNGVRVNGDRITAPTKVEEGDLIEIGDYDLGVQGRIEFPTTPPAVSPKPRTTIPPTAAHDGSGAPAGQAVSPGSAATPSATAGGATAIIRVSDLAKNAPQVEVRDLQKSEMPRLIGLSGNIRGKEFYLMRTEVKVGRSEDNDIPIDHQSISRQHARFVREDAAWKVVDNKSANGVHINGELYAISAVKPGDTIELGHLKFRFCAPGEKFTLPAEKEESKPGRPTTVELIAGARPDAKAPAAKKRKLALFVGGGALLAVAVAVALVVAGKAKRTGDEGGDGDLSAAEATKAGDREFKKHEYLKAIEYYDAAAAKGETPPNRTKAQDEARAQEIDRGIDRAIAAGDFDKAKALHDKCATEATWFCQKAQEKVDQIKSGYGKTHLAKAQAAKGAGKADVCRQEVQQVLAFDPASAEAQALQCAPQQGQGDKPGPARHEGGLSQAQRDAKAKQLLQDGNTRIAAKDFTGAISKYQAALDVKPSKDYVGLAYRGLGTAAVYAGDTKAAVRWYKLYMPYADEATKGQLQALIDKFGG